MSESSESEQEASRSKGVVNRKPQGYWAEFNAWWRAEYEGANNQRPSNGAVDRWHKENAERVWPDPKTRPDVSATRTHAKCMRTTESVRDYFRQYRHRAKAKVLKEKAREESTAVKQWAAQAAPQPPPAPAAHGMSHQQTSSISNSGMQYAAAAATHGADRNQPLRAQQYMYSFDLPHTPTSLRQAERSFADAAIFAQYNAQNGDLAASSLAASLVSAPAAPLQATIGSATGLPSFTHHDNHGQQYSMEWLDAYQGSNLTAGLPEVSVPPPQYDMPIPTEAWFQSEQARTGATSSRGQNNTNSTSPQVHETVNKTPSYAVITTDVLQSPPRQPTALHWSQNHIKERMHQVKTEEQSLQGWASQQGLTYSTGEELHSTPAKILRDEHATSVGNAASRQNIVGSNFTQQQAGPSFMQQIASGGTLPLHVVNGVLYQAGGEYHQGQDILQHQQQSPSCYGSEQAYQQHGMDVNHAYEPVILQHAPGSTVSTFDAAAASSVQFATSTMTGVLGTGMQKMMPHLVPQHQMTSSGVGSQVTLSPILTTAGNKQQPSHSSQESLLMQHLESPTSSSGPHPFLAVRPSSVTPPNPSRLVHTSTPTSTPTIPPSTLPSPGAGQQCAVGTSSLPSLRLPQSAIDRFLSAEPTPSSHLMTHGPPVATGAHGYSITTFRGTPTKRSGAVVAAQRAIENAARQAVARANLPPSPRAWQQAAIQGMGIFAHTPSHAGVYTVHGQPRQEAADESLMQSFLLDGKPSWASWGDHPAAVHLVTRPSEHLMQANLMFVDSPLAADIQPSPFGSSTPNDPAGSTTSTRPAATMVMVSGSPVEPVTAPLVSKGGSRSGSSGPPSPGRNEQPTGDTHMHSHTMDGETPGAMQLHGHNMDGQATGDVQLHGHTIGKDVVIEGEGTLGHATEAGCCEVPAFEAPSAAGMAQTGPGAGQLPTASSVATAQDDAGADCKQVDQAVVAKTAVDVVATDAELVTANMQLA